MALPNLLNARKALCFTLCLAPFICQGFDFTLTVDPSGPGPCCGVLRCSEKVPDTTQAVSGDSSDISRTISSLTIYKLSQGDGALGGAHWGKMAAVTSQSPRENRTTDRLTIRGDLAGAEGSLTLEMTNPDDCMSEEFYCAAVLVNSENGQSTLMKSFIKSTDSSASSQHSVAEGAENFPSWDLANGPSEVGSVGCNRMDDRFLVSMWEKLKCIEKRIDDYSKKENRLEDKIDDLKDHLKDEISDKLQASEIRAGDRIDRLENRLEDKLSGLTIGTNLRENNADVCSEISSKLSTVADTVETIEKNLTNFDDQLYRAEAAATLSASTATALDSKLSNLTSDISTVSSLTDNLVTDLAAFRSSYSSGALVPVDDFFDALGTGRKEWRLAFRGTAYNNVAVYPAYLYGTGIPAEVEAGCKQFDHSLPCTNHYRNRDAMDNWGNVDEVLFAIYVKGQIVKKVVFNAHGSNNINWFEASRVIVSSWTDLKTTSHNVFSIVGLSSFPYIRKFYISNHHQACPLGRGWFAATDNADVNNCPYEKDVAFPVFLYSPLSSMCTWRTTPARRADAIGIFLKYH